MLLENDVFKAVPVVTLVDRRAVPEEIGILSHDIRSQFIIECTANL